MDKHRFADYVVIVIQRKGDERGHDIPTITGGVLRGQCAKKDPVVLVSIGGCLRPERDGGGAICYPVCVTICQERPCHI